MRRGIRGFMMMVVAIVVIGTGNRAMAQCSCDIHHIPYDYNVESQHRKVYTEWGVGVGVVYTGINTLSTSVVSLQPRYGFQGHFDMAVCFGRNFAIETEIAYEGGSMDVKLGDLERRVRLRELDIPVLLSLRFLDSRIRLAAGPLFAVKSSGEYSVEGESYLYGPMLPTWNIAAGVGLRLGKHFIIEARYVHPLVDTVNQFGAIKGNENAGVEFNTRCYKISAGVTILF